MEAVFLAKQEQLEQKIDRWVEQAGDKLLIDYVKSYSGHHVYAFTLSDFTVPREQKTALYIAQPHAHEPATTAGMIDVIEQLVTGKDLLGSPTAIDRDKVFSSLIITFNPLGNPYGRDHAPYACWDGSKVSNPQFWCVMRGEDPERPGEMWGRYGLFDTREVTAPDPMGIVYEPIDEYRFVEPNRNQQSSFFKLFHLMDKQYGYRYWLDLHQTEFARSPSQCLIMEPLEDVPPNAIKAENNQWAEQVSQAWHEAGFKVSPPKPLPYVGEQAAYFRENWSDIDRRLHRITVEVKNNGADVPAARQIEAMVLSITETFQRLTKES